MKPFIPDGDLGLNVLGDQESKAWFERTVWGFFPSPEVTLSALTRFLTCHTFCCSDTFPKGLWIVALWSFTAKRSLPTVFCQKIIWTWAQFQDGADEVKLWP